MSLSSHWAEKRIGKEIQKEKSNGTYEEALSPL
jgi:hypothetical protein